MITVVITNYKRPLLLMEAFRSCLAANVKHIVISSSGTDAELAVIHRRIKAIKPDTTITAIPNDLGCNEMWLRGAKLVTTPWTYILHDDDWVLPRFGLLERELDPDISYYHWDCAKHGMGTFGKHSYFPNMPAGIYPSTMLAGIMTNPSYNSISPVAGLFKTDHVVETLAECEKNFGPNFLWRENMMVGNDLMLWLRATEKYPLFKFYTEPMASYGYWEGSTSCIDAHERRLLPIYNRTRGYWLKNKLKKQ
jgi:hypothetical protein